MKKSDAKRDLSCKIHTRLSESREGVLQMKNIRIASVEITKKALDSCSPFRFYFGVRIFLDKINNKQ